MKTKSKRPRRATILLMVVSVLALLFVIVTGFLSLARVNRGIVIDVGRGDLADAIVEETNAWAFSLIKDQVLDDTGGVLAGGGASSYSHEDIPGYRRSNYIAALEPVWDPGWAGTAFGWAPSWGVLEQLRWPAVTSLDDGVALPQPFAIYQLMRDYDPTQSSFGASPSGGDRYDNVRWNARNPFMDADGDGVPDSHFLLCAAAIEAANAAAGASASLPRFVSNDPNDLNSFVPFCIPPDNSGAAEGFRGERWQRYDQQARYEVAMRVISHGGMVTLDSPTLYDEWNGSYVPFNRDFTIDLFDAIRNTGDTAMRRQYRGLKDQNRLFDALYANVAGVEPALRRRFILPGPATPEGRYGVASRSVPILAELLGERDGWGFPSTLVPTFTVQGSAGPRERSGERINLGVEASRDDERRGWARAVSWDATEYNGSGSGFSTVDVSYDRRHLVTTVNYSDELARKHDPNDPVPTLAKPFDLGAAGARGATFEGELKFYLGEVTKAFIEVDGFGDAPSPGSGRYRFEPIRGRVIIERLARLYHDMLAGHSSATGNDGWASVFATSGTSGKQAVSRRQQALMLAVNTVAFAAPWNTADDSRGFIDVVRYYDDPLNATPSDLTDDDVYVGYAPQPFFSEVIAYTDKDDADDLGDDPLKPNTAVAVELYNPNDAYYDFSGGMGPYPDVYALRLDQFAIGVENANPNNLVAYPPGSKWAPLPGLMLAGRSFKTVVVKSNNGESTDHFDLDAQGLARPSVTLDIVSDRTSNGDDSLAPTTFTLWRKSASESTGHVPGAGLWYPVDKIDVIVAAGNGSSKVWRGVHRDTTPARYFAMVDLDNSGTVDAAGEDGNGDTYPDTYARWNVVVARKQGQSYGGGKQPAGAPDKGSLDNHTWLQCVTKVQGAPVNPDAIGTVTPFAPTVPLITMNAGPTYSTTVPLHWRFNDLPVFRNVRTAELRRDLRPRSFPTVGFMFFIPRFSHIQRPTLTKDKRDVPTSQVLAEQWTRQSYGSAQPGYYPADFGHMPVFDNTQNVPSGSYFDNTNGVGNVPWGLLVFDYFTTLNPLQDVNEDQKPDVDPLRVPGRININTAPWYVLANLPMLGPTDGTPATPGNWPGPAAQLPIRASAAVLFPGVSSASGPSNGPLAPSPSFWDPRVGVLTGVAYDVVNATLPVYRLLACDPTYQGGALLDRLSMPWYANKNGRYRLGPWLAQAAAAYRDGVQYVSNNMNNAFCVYADSQLRNLATVPYRLPNLYGTVRGASPTAGAPPTQFGFVTVGELLNVKGFDSSDHIQLPPFGTAASTTLGSGFVYSGDFVKAVSLMALLDTQYLTTRSNTFTVYTSVMDREDPQRSVRSQVTVDRSNLLPRLTYAYSFYDAVTPPYCVKPCNPASPLNPDDAAYPLAPFLLDVDGDDVPETPVRTTNAGAEPRVIASEQVGYFNVRYDD